jgi:hypothetical protein
MKRLTLALTVGLCLLFAADASSCGLVARVVTVPGRVVYKVGKVVKAVLPPYGQRKATTTTSACAPDCAPACAPVVPPVVVPETGAIKFLPKAPCRRRRCPVR